MALSEGPFGTYTGTEIASANAQTEIIANINSFKALIPGTAIDPASPDFNQIDPAVGDVLRADLDALIVVVEAMPTA